MELNKYWKCKNRKIYHLLTCNTKNNASPSNIEYIQNSQQCRACKICKPDKQHQNNQMNQERNTGDGPNTSEHPNPQDNSSKSNVFVNSRIRGMYKLIFVEFVLIQTIVEMAQERMEKLKASLTEINRTMEIDEREK